jgi:hypothetical protein
MPKIDLQHGWQNGPASIEVECDEVMLDGEVIGTGVMLDILTTLDVEDASVDLGLLRVDLPPTKAAARLTLCASIEQARAIRDALSAIISGEGVA